MFGTTKYVLEEGVETSGIVQIKEEVDLQDGIQIKRELSGEKLQRTKVERATGDRE